MKQNLWRETIALYHYSASLRVNEICPNLWGDYSNLQGDCSDLRGDCSGLRGDCSGLRGDCSGLRGDLDGCEISDSERLETIDIATLLEEQLHSRKLLKIRNDTE